MRKLMDRVFAHYGVQAQLQTVEGTQQVKVFFHSVNSRSWQNMEQAMFALGELQRGQYICVFPVEAAVSAGDTVTVRDRAYLVRRVEEMSAHTGPVYQWALCVVKGGESTWGLTE